MERWGNEEVEVEVVTDNAVGLGRGGYRIAGSSPAQVEDGQEFASHFVPTDDAGVLVAVAGLLSKIEFPRRFG